MTGAPPDAAPEPIGLEWKAYVESRYAYLDSGRMSADFERMVRPLLAPTARRVLDVGTGPGQHLAGLASLLPDAVLHGFDISAPYLATARAELASRGAHASLARAEGAHLPYRDGGFDLVLSHLTMPYVLDERAFLAECLRVLAPGGCLWLTTHGVGFFVRYVVEGPPYFKVRYLASLAAGAASMALGWKPLADTPVTPGWLRRRLAHSGLDVRHVEWDRYGPWPRILAVSGIKR